MKKLTLAVAVAGALVAGTANAYNIGQAATGLLVPNVIHNGAADTTTVGIVSRNAGTVYWVFFDMDSMHVTDGQFKVTANDQHNFVWAAEAGIGLEGERGYLVFTLDTDKDGGDGVIAHSDAIGYMTGNAFQVNTAAKDVAFLPTLGLVANADLSAATADVATSDYVLPVSLATMQGKSITSARLTAVQAGDRIDLRYFIDNKTGGDDTVLAFWTADEMPAPIVWTVDMYDNAQNRKSVNFPLVNDNLNFINVEDIAGRPANFLDGFLNVGVPAFGTLTPGLRTATDNCPNPYAHSATGTVTANCVGGVISYSVISSPSFGAVQTLIGTHN